MSYNSTINCIDIGVVRAIEASWGKHMIERVTQFTC